MLSPIRRLNTHHLLATLTVFAVAGAGSAWLWPAPAALAAEMPLPAGRPELERAMREYAGRCEAVGGVVPLWLPSLPGDGSPIIVATSRPADGFYGGLENRPDYAAAMVQKLVDAFFGFETKDDGQINNVQPLYASFTKPGASSPDEAYKWSDLSGDWGAVVGRALTEDENPAKLVNAGNWREALTLVHKQIRLLSKPIGGDSPIRIPVRLTDIRYVAGGADAAQTPGPMDTPLRWGVPSGSSPAWSARWSASTEWPQGGSGQIYTQAEVRNRVKAAYESARDRMMVDLGNNQTLLNGDPLKAGWPASGSDFSGWTEEQKARLLGTSLGHYFDVRVWGVTGYVNNFPFPPYVQVSPTDVQARILTYRVTGQWMLRRDDILASGQEFPPGTQFDIVRIRNQAAAGSHEMYFTAWSPDFLHSGAMHGTTNLSNPNDPDNLVYGGSDPQDPAHRLGPFAMEQVLAPEKNGTTLTTQAQATGSPAWFSNPSLHRFLQAGQGDQYSIAIGEYGRYPLTEQSVLLPTFATPGIANAIYDFSSGSPWMRPWSRQVYDTFSNSVVTQQVYPSAATELVATIEPQRDGDGQILDTKSSGVAGVPSALVDGDPNLGAVLNFDTLFPDGVTEGRRVFGTGLTTQSSLWAIPKTFAIDTSPEIAGAPAEANRGGSGTVHVGVAEGIEGESAKEWTVAVDLGEVAPGQSGGVCVFRGLAGRPFQDGSNGDTQFRARVYTPTGTSRLVQNVGPLPSSGGIALLADQGAGRAVVYRWKNPVSGSLVEVDADPVGGMSLAEYATGEVESGAGAGATVLRKVELADDVAAAHGLKVTETTGGSAGAETLSNVTAVAKSGDKWTVTECEAGRTGSQLTWTREGSATGGIIEQVQDGTVVTACRDWKYESEDVSGGFQAHRLSSLHVYADAAKAVAASQAAFAYETAANIPGRRLKSQTGELGLAEEYTYEGKGRLASEAVTLNGQPVRTTTLKYLDEARRHGTPDSEGNSPPGSLSITRSAAPAFNLLPSASGYQGYADVREETVKAGVKTLAHRFVVMPHEASPGFMLPGGQHIVVSAADAGVLASKTTAQAACDLAHDPSPALAVSHALVRSFQVNGIPGGATTSLTLAGMGGRLDWTSPTEQVSGYAGANNAADAYGPSYSIQHGISHAMYRDLATGQEIRYQSRTVRGIGPSSGGWVQTTQEHDLCESAAALAYRIPDKFKVFHYGLKNADGNGWEVDPETTLPAPFMESSAVCDAWGRPVSATDAEGVVTKITSRDGQGRVTGKKIAEGDAVFEQTQTLAYLVGNRPGLATTTTAKTLAQDAAQAGTPTARTESAAFDLAGRPVEAINALGEKTYVIYKDTGGVRETRHYPAGPHAGPIQVTQEDGLGRVIAKSTAVAEGYAPLIEPTTQLTGGTAEQKTAAALYKAWTSPPNGTENLVETSRTEQVHDGLDRVVVTRERYQGTMTAVETRVYDLLGRLAGTQDALGDLAAFVYDNQDRVVAVAKGVKPDQLKLVGLNRYNLSRNATGTDVVDYATRTAVIAPKDAASAAGWNLPAVAGWGDPTNATLRTWAADLTLDETRLHATDTTLAQDDFSLTTTVKPAGLPAQKTVSDHAGRLLTKETLAVNNPNSPIARVSHAYPAAGAKPWRLLSSTRKAIGGDAGTTASDLTTQFAYDTLGRVEKTTAPTGAVTWAQRDGFGRTVRTRVLANGATVEQSFNQYDLADRLTTKITSQARPGTTAELLTGTNAEATTRTLRYDNGGRVVHEAVLNRLLTGRPTEEAGTGHHHRAYWYVDSTAAFTPAWTSSSNSPTLPTLATCVVEAAEDGVRQESWRDSMGHEVLIRSGVNRTAEQADEKNIVRWFDPAGNLRAQEVLVPRKHTTNGLSTYYAQTTLWVHRAPTTGAQLGGRAVDNMSGELADPAMPIPSHHLPLITLLPDASSQTGSGAVTPATQIAAYSACGLASAATYDRIERTYMADGSVRAEMDQCGRIVTRFSLSDGRPQSMVVSHPASMFNRGAAGLAPAQGSSGVQRVTYGYDIATGLPRAVNVQEFNSGPGNYVAYRYDGLLRPVDEIQSHVAALADVTGGDMPIGWNTQPRVSRAFTATGAQASLTYASGRVLNCAYTGPDAALGRPSRLTDATAGGFDGSWQFLGLSTPVQKVLPGLHMTMGTADDHYAGYNGWWEARQPVYTAGGQTVLSAIAQRDATGFVKAYLDPQHPDRSRVNTRDAQSNVETVRTGQTTGTGASGDPVKIASGAIISSLIRDVDALGHPVSNGQITNTVTDGGELADASTDTIAVPVARGPNFNTLTTAPAGYGVQPTGGLSNGDLSVVDVTTDPLVVNGALRVGAGSALDPAVAVLPLEGPLPTDCVLRMPSQGAAGIVFGWKSSLDHWTWTVDALTGLRRLHRVTAGPLGQPLKTLVATQTGSPVPANTWVTLSLAANNAMADTRYANMDLSAYGGFPVGQWGFYTEVAGTDFDYFTQRQSNQAASLGAQFAGRGNARVVAANAGMGGNANLAAVAATDDDDGKLAVTGGTSGQGTTEVRGFHSRRFRMNLDLTRPETAAKATVGAVLLRRDEGNYLDIQVPHSNSPGTANRTVTVREFVNGAAKTVTFTGPGLAPQMTSATQALKVEVEATDAGINLYTWPADGSKGAAAMTIAWNQVGTQGAGVGLKGGASGTAYVDNCDIRVPDGSNPEIVELHEEYRTKFGRIPVDYAYDPAGNRVFDGCFYCKFDAFNRVTEVYRARRDTTQTQDSATGLYPIKPGTQLAAYRYDAEGRRITKGGKVGTDLGLVWQHRYFDGDDLVEVRQGDNLNPGAVLKQYVYGLDGRVASLRANIDPANNPDLDDATKQKDLSYAWTAEGDVQGLYDAQTGEGLEHYVYDVTGRRTIWRKPYWTVNGTQVVSNGARETEHGLAMTAWEGVLNGDLNDFGWRGGEHDEAGGLVYLDGRDYDPFTGLFIEKAEEGNSKDYAMEARQRQQGLEEVAERHRRWWGHRAAVWAGNAQLDARANALQFFSGRLDDGDGAFWAGTQATVYTAGGMVGYRDIVEGFGGADLTENRLLEGRERRWRAGIGVVSTAMWFVGPGALSGGARTGIGSTRMALKVGMRGGFRLGMEAGVYAAGRLTAREFAKVGFEMSLRGSLQASGLRSPLVSAMARGIEGRLVSQSSRVVSPVIFNATESLAAIYSSGRVWGQTEGAVYGMTVRNAPWWRTMANPKTIDAGTLIFEGEAAKLFRPHPVEGWYSGIKRLLGQQKAGFGDIVFDTATATLDGNTLVIRNATIGSHVGQTTFRAQSRLWGRRIGIEWGIPAAAGGAAWKTYRTYKGDEE